MQTGPQLSPKALAEAFTAKTALERGGEVGKCHLEKGFGLLLALFLGEPASSLEGVERRRESTVNFSSKYCTSNTGKKKSIQNFELLHAALPPLVKVHTIYVMSLFLNIRFLHFFFFFFNVTQF